MSKQAQFKKKKVRITKDWDFLNRLIASVVFLITYFLIINWVNPEESLAALLSHSGRTMLVVFPWIILLIIFTIDITPRKRSSPRKNKRT